MSIIYKRCVYVVMIWVGGGAGLKDSKWFENQMESLGGQIGKLNWELCDRFPLFAAKFLI